MWRPHPGPQTEFCQRSEFEALYGGAAGPGKTDCLVALATRHVAVPGYQAILLRRTFPQLREIMDRCWNLYPSIGGTYKATEKRWYFPTEGRKSFVELGHMQHEDDKHNYQGRQFHFAGFDELTQFSQDQYLYITGSRVRSVNPNLPPRVRSTTNPGGVGHLWCKERFVDNATPGRSFIDPGTGLTRVFIPGKIYDNPTLIDSDPAYLARLEALPRIERRRLLDGDWEVFEGQVFSTLSQRVHGCEPFEVPPEWERFMSFDWGFSKPFSVGWWAVDYDGVLYRYREWYGCKKDEPDQGLQMTAAEVANGIEERERGDVVPRMRIADPAIFAKLPSKRRREAIGPGVSDDFNAAGIYFMKADNDRLQGLQQVHKRLRLEEQLDKETGEVIAEHPSIQIFTSCRDFWRTVPALQHDPKNVEDVDGDQEDHIYDEVRYACMSRPLAPKRVTGPPKGSVAYERAKLQRARRMARLRGMSLEAAYRRLG